MAPIVMFNALWFRPDGGEERYYSGYGTGAAPILERVGADLMTPFMPLEAAFEGGFDPSVVGFVRYPSAEAFDEMWHSDAYSEVAPLRRDSVDRAVLTRCAIDPADGDPIAPMPGIVVLNMLWFKPGGRARYDDYLHAVRPLVADVGGALASIRFIPDEAIEDDVVPDLIFLGNYPSLDALAAMAQSPEYAEVSQLRTAAVRHTMTTALKA